ncbi:MAG: ATP-binding protein [Asticcacaulis sp.]
MSFARAEQGLDRSRGGLGLGLTLVRGFVRLHGGDVEADSAGPGQGATFTITLPVAAEEPVTAPAAAPSPTVARKQRILLIEDNRDAAETLHLMLGLEGPRRRCRPTAQAGLARARGSGRT